MPDNIVMYIQIDEVDFKMSGFLSNNYSISLIKQRFIFFEKDQMMDFQNKLIVLSGKQDFRQINFELYSRADNCNFWNL